MTTMRFIIQALCLVSAYCWGSYAALPVADFPEGLVRPPTQDELDEPGRIDYSREIVRPLSSAEIDQVVQLTSLDQQMVSQLQTYGQHSIEHEKLADMRINADVRAFCVVQGIPLPQAAPTQSVVPPEKPVDPATTMVVSCDKGVYFDSHQGLLVYIGNVRLRDPRLDLDCDNQLKVYLKEDTSPAPKEKEKKPKDPNAPVTPADNMKTNFDGLRKVTAEGNVVLNRKDDKGKSYQARAQRLTYDAITGEILLTGGRPWLQDEKNIVRCLTDEGYIRVDDKGRVYVHGRTSTMMRDIQNQSSALRKSNQKSNRSTSSTGR